MRRKPQVRVSGKGSGGINLAGMIAVLPGFRTRLIYRVSSLNSLCSRGLWSKG